MKKKLYYPEADNLTIDQHIHELKAYKKSQVNKLKTFYDTESRTYYKLVKMLFGLRERKVTNEKLINYLVYVLAHLHLMPYKIDFYKRFGEAYFDLKYEVKQGVELVFRINLRVCVRYVFEGGEHCENPDIYYGDNVPKWIDTFTKELKESKIKKI